MSSDSSSGIGIVNNRAEQLALMLQRPFWRGEMGKSMTVVMDDGGVPRAKYGELRYARDRLRSFLRTVLSYVLYFSVILVVVVGSKVLIGLFDHVRSGF